MPSLNTLQGRDQGKTFLITQSATMIGREASSDIQLLDTETSRRHAEIRRVSADCYDLIDLDSSNGTRINGKRITCQRLRNGDQIEIGSTAFVFSGLVEPSSFDVIPKMDIVLKHGNPDNSQIVSNYLRRSDLSSRDDFSTRGNAITPPATPIQDSSDSQLDDSPNRREPERALEVIYQTALAVGRTDELDQVLHRVLQLVFDWIDADRGCIMLRDQSTGTLEPAARRDRNTDQNPQSAQTISISQTILDHVLEQQTGVRTSNAKRDHRFESAASIVQSGIREALCVPLQGRYAIVGLLYVDTYTSPGQISPDGHRSRFNDDHLELTTAIGHQAALAIEDTFYYSTLLKNERLAAMGQTITSLSHHIKNILQGIRGGSFLIESGLEQDDTKAVRRGWKIVDRNQERISNLVLDMLTYSKDRKPDKKLSNLNEVAKEIAESLEPRAKSINVQVQLDLLPELPDSWFDTDSMHRALLNLVINAMDALDESQRPHTDAHSPPDHPPVPPGQIRIRTDYQNNQWIVEVIDNGPGIPPGFETKLFSLFESSKGARGTGIGLPVSAKIVQEHGGKLEAIDHSPERGTTFRITLPNAEPENEPENEQQDGNTLVN